MHLNVPPRFNRCVPRPVRLATAALLAAIGPFAPSAAAQAVDGIGLRLQPELIDPARRPTDGVPVFGAADRITGRPEENIELDGRAQLRKAGSVINADRIVYETVEDEVLARGNVRIVRDGDVYSGPELRLKVDLRQGYFLSPTYERAAGGRGQAARIDFLGPEQSLLTDTTYTTCTPDNVDWYVAATSIALDEASQTGSGRNAVVYFKGVPIFALPFFTFPLTDERKTGFLPPTFSLTSRSGPELMVPFYWNIAPNHDLTLYPKYIGLRGAQIGARFRYLEPTFSGNVRAEVLPRDQVAGRSRYSFAALHQWRDGPWSATWDINKVSDDNYFVDFSRTIAAASQRTLPRDVILNYGDPAGAWSMVGRVLRYQTLQDLANPIARPYEKLPQLAWHGERRDMGGLDLVADADLTRFHNTTLVDGTRLVVNPRLSWPIIAPGYFITPKVALHATRYSLANLTAPTDPRELSRVVPTTSVEAGLVFERDARLFGRNLRQTLEPRLFYVRTPYRDQSQFPNFDSGLPDLSFAQLFSENPFAGSDRIADANHLTAAVVSRLLDPSSGAEQARVAIAQRFYLSPQRVTLPGGLPVNQSASDFLATASADVTPRLTAEMGVQYSQQVDAVVRATAGARWRPEAGKVLNGAYRYLRGTLNQADVSGQWPLGGGWHGVGRVNYSMRDKRVIETLGGIEYEACCWIARVVTQRFATATAKATTTLFVQLELKGFSRIGSNPLDAIRRNVPGYTVLNPNLSPPAPFQNYE